MSDLSVRRGVTQARFNEKNSSILFGEIFLIALVVGLSMKSWWAFGITFVALLVVIAIRPLALAFVGLLSVGWGMVGYSFGGLFQSTAAAAVLAIIGFLVGLGVHMSGLEWSQDVNAER